MRETCEGMILDWLAQNKHNPVTFLELLDVEGSPEDVEGQMAATGGVDGAGAQQQANGATLALRTLFDLARRAGSSADLRAAASFDVDMTALTKVRTMRQILF